MSRRNERGAVAVEFAILLPVLVVILFGITTFGLAFSRLETYISAAREGARYAALHCQPSTLTPPAPKCMTQSQILDRVTQAAGGYPIDQTGGPGSPAASPLDCTTGSPVTVSWIQPISIQIPFLPDLSKDVTISAVFRCE